MNFGISSQNYWERPRDILASDPNNQAASITKTVNLTHVVSEPEVEYNEGNMSLYVDGNIISVGNIASVQIIVDLNSSVLSVVNGSSGSAGPISVKVVKGNSINGTFIIQFSLPNDLSESEVVEAWQDDKPYTTGTFYLIDNVNCNMVPIGIITDMLDGNSSSYIRSINVPFTLNITGDEFSGRFRFMN